MKTAAFSILSLLALVVPLSSACDDAPTRDDDELAGETSLDGEALGKADGVAENFTFFTMRQDFRKCMYPMCGGQWVSRVNRAYSRCADGTVAEECYVSDVDWASSQLVAEDVDALMSNKDKLLVRARIAPVDFEGMGVFGTLEVSEGWFGGSDGEPLGLFTRVRDSGLRCITTPCPNTLLEGKINSWRSTDLSELYLDDTGVGQEEIDGAYAEVYGDDGLIVAGFRYWYWDDLWIKGRYVTQFYERFRAE